MALWLTGNFNGCSGRKPISLVTVKEVGLIYYNKTPEEGSQPQDTPYSALTCTSTCQTAIAMPTLQFSGVVLYYETFGSGPLLVLSNPSFRNTPRGFEVYPGLPLREILFQNG